MYTRRKKEINYVSGAYFTDIIIHYGFGERLRVFHACLEKLLHLLATDLTVVGQISNIIAALLWIPYQVSSNAEGIYALYLKQTVMKVKEYGLDLFISMVPTMKLLI